eukprot:sb/3465245/
MVHINGGDEITMDEVDPLYSLTVGSPPLYSTQNSTHQSIASSSSSGQLRDAPTPSTSTAGGADGGVGEITADQQGGSPDVSGDPGYSSDTERTLDKAVEVKEQKLYPDNCLRFDLLSCYKCPTPPHKTNFNIFTTAARGVKLNSCYGEFYGGQVTAITGPAGSGRSTLLKILAGIKVKNSKGRIKVGNIDRTTQIFKERSSYIPHHCMISHLTVKETLQCSAIACCSSSLSEHDRNKEIMKILDLLLTTDILNKKVYDLTLVEQRILCLATELLRKPTFIFIQDPLKSPAERAICRQNLATSASVNLCSPNLTSSLLHTYRDLNIQHQMFYLNRLMLLRKENIAVVLCMKNGISTATLQFIDNLYILAEGFTVYSGPPSDLSKFFKDASDDPTFPDIHLGKYIGTQP